jgi:hypothetical protein
MEFELQQMGKISFYTPKLDQEKHPKGCYTDECGDNVIQGTGKCVYFNKVYNHPAGTLTGTIVCYRNRLVNGTANSDGSIDSCPGTEYEPITGIAKCQEAAQCLGYAANSLPHFVVDDKNRTLHDYYTQGCLIHTIPNAQGVIGTVSFNPQRNKVDGSHWTPGAPHGTPICVVKNPARTVEWANDNHGRAAHAAGSGNQTTVQAATNNAPGA